MPTNVTPEYKKAKEAFQKARDPAERLSWLKEMLRLLPKHKGTEHLQAEIKKRIKELTEELKAPKKGGARTGPVVAVRPEGAAQVALLGPPNSGKSALHAKLTGSHAEVGPYEYTTTVPLPGMLPFEDIYFQLVDLPPVSVEFMEPWMPNALQPARAALLVVDLSSPGCVENVTAIIKKLDAKRVTLTGRWGNPIDEALLDLRPAKEETEGVRRSGDDEEEREIEETFRKELPTLLVANKCDLGKDVEEVKLLEELAGVDFPALCVSALTGEGLERIGPILFQGLGVVRVYTKVPGKKPDMDRPYTFFSGDTIHDVAMVVHREIASSLKYARIWGSGRFEGQQVGRDYQVRDGDVVELHV